MRFESISMSSNVDVHVQWCRSPSTLLSTHVNLLVIFWFNAHAELLTIKSELGIIIVRFFGDIVTSYREFKSFRFKIEQPIGHIYEPDLCSPKTSFIFRDASIKHAWWRDIGCLTLLFSESPELTRNVLDSRYLWNSLRFVRYTVVVTVSGIPGLPQKLKALRRLLRKGSYYQNAPRICSDTAFVRTRIPELRAFFVFFRYVILFLLIYVRMFNFHLSSLKSAHCWVLFFTMRKEVHVTHKQFPFFFRKVPNVEDMQGIVAAGNSFHRFWYLTGIRWNDPDAVVVTLHIKPFLHASLAEQKW